MSQTSAKPNILLIMTDQHRHDYLSCAGADFVHTPNIDRIARRGMRFTNCFTNAPVCVPARIGLATGLKPHRLGSLNNVSSLPADVPTYYKHLRDHGYRVGCVGKLDLNKEEFMNGRHGDRPRVFGWGFTHPVEVEGKMHAGRFPEPHGPYGFYLQKKGLYDKFHQDYADRFRVSWSTGASAQFRNSALSAEDFADSYTGRRAAQWLADIGNDYPWHLFVSFAGPHDPFDPPQNYSERCRDRQVPSAVEPASEGKPGWIRRRQSDFTAEEIRTARRQYCASIELIDDQIGQILDVLENKGLTESTYIIFASDHGEMLGDLGLFQKSVPYEAALRVPLLIAGPDIQPGSASAALVELFDINPTISQLAGLPPQPDLDAMSLNGITSGDQQQHREQITARLHNFACVRDTRYKYINNYNDVPELYDLVNDPQEQINLVKSEPQVVKKFARLVGTGH